MKATRKIRKITRIISLFSGFLLITAFVLNAGAAGQTVSAENDSLRIKYFTREDGLSQASVWDLLQDQAGIVWIATADGLNRFDGTKFQHYKFSASDTTTISGNFVQTIYEDNTGNIWAGTRGNGLNYYDKNLDSFYRFNLENSQTDGETISDIVTDENGVLWVATLTSGLHRLEPTGEGSFLQHHFLQNQSLSSISIDQHKNLWTAGEDGQVYKLNLSDPESSQITPEVNLDKFVWAFYHTDENVLIGSMDGLFIYDINMKTVQRFELETSGAYQDDFINSFLREDDDRVWIGTSNGIYLFDHTDMRVARNIRYTADLPGGLSDNSVFSLLRLSPDQILVGTNNNGLNLLDFSDPYFKNISKDQLNDNIVWSVFGDGNDLWIGTSNGGLNLIREDTIYYFNVDPNDPKSISGSWVSDIIKDETNQRLWLATANGLSMIDLEFFDPDDPEFTVFRHDPDDPNTISHDFISNLTFDKHGNLWGASFGEGIFRLELSGENNVLVTRYHKNSNDPNSLINDFVHSIMTDQHHNIWVGTDGGVTKLSFTDDDYNNPIFTNYNKDSSSDKTLLANSVSDIMEDKENRIWLATDQGLNLFLGDKQFESWTEQEQFPNAAVYSIQDDEEGQLWLGTNDGIVKFNPEEKQFTHYRTEDGIQGSEFSATSKFRSKSGHIYFGGTGVTYFHPDDLEQIDVPVPLYFSQLRVKDQIVKPANTGEHFLKQSLQETDEVEFQHHQFPFYLQFSTIDYRIHRNIQYAYKLLPDDTKWNLLSEPEIQFLNLPAGSYTLLVNGFSRGEEWAQDPLEMNLHILPPWWRSWWAYLIYLCLIGGLAWRFYRFQISRKLAVAESERLREINQLKNNLYTNITHEFRTPLTVILGMTDALKSKIQNKDLAKTNESLGMIERNGKKLLRLVNEILDLTKLESGNMELQLLRSDIIPFVKYIGESFQSLAEESQINLTVYSEIDELVMDFDADKLSTVLTNLLSNAIKFTPRHGKIIVHVNRILETNDEVFMVKVKDNGAGIPEEALPHIFDRFYQADSSASRRGEGTGIGLALTKELVERMGGTIDVKSVLDKGSEFTVRLPVTRDGPEKAWSAPSDEPHQLVSVSTDAQDNGGSLPEDSDDLPVALLLEDNKDVAEYLKTCLNGKYQTLHAGDGIEGIDMACEHIPDIIICDVMMPGKDGFEVCSTLKTDERTDHIPMIMLTAKATKKDRLTGLSHGADAYLTKPFSKSELFTRMDQLVLLRQKMLQKFESVGFSQLLKSRSQSPETKFIQKIIKIIHEEISSDSLNSKQLVHKLHLSESQLYRKLKAITGKSTAVFIRSVRLQKAKELILATDKSISEIAYDTGFNDPSWFSRAYKEEFGFPPSETYK